MNFEEAGRQYSALQEQFAQKLLSARQFEESVGKLIAVAPDGKRWRIEPYAGTWSEVIGGQPPAVSGKPGEKAPETLLELLVLIAKSMVKKLPVYIMLGLLMAGLTWVTHTYIIAKINDGLMYNAGRVAVNSVVHLQQTHFPGVNLFWGVLSYFLSGFIMRARYMGLQKWFDGIIRLPHNIKESWIRGGEKSLSIAVFGVFLALLFGCVFRNFMLSQILFLGTVLVMTAHFASLETLTLKLALSDLQKLVRRKFVPDGAEYDSVYLALLGLCAGFALAGLWRTKFILTIISAVLFLGLFIFLVVAKQKNVQKMASFLVVLGGGLFLLELPVLAYCEGGSLSQVGGNWIDWWGSNNADVVRVLGLTPAGFSFIGSILGSAAAITGGTVPGAVLVAGLPNGTSAITAGGLGSLFTRPDLMGDPGGNPYTVFEGGKGPGRCGRPGLPNYWVNTATLGLVVRDTVFAAQGLGPEVDLTMTYNSASTVRGIFGRGWSFSFDWVVEEAGDKALLNKGNGQQIAFTILPGADPAGSPQELTPPAGCFDRMLLYGDYWLYLAKNSRVMHRFDRVPGTPLARLTGVSDYYGNFVAIGFDAAGNIGSVTDAAGRAILFEYNEQNLCTSFTLPDGRRAIYAYDNHENLVRAVDLLGVETEYGYDSDNRLTQMVVGREKHTTVFGYRRQGGTNLVEAVIDAAGNTTRYALQSGQPGLVRVTGPDGRSTQYLSAGGLTEAVTDHLGHALRYTFENGLPVSLRDQNGRVTGWRYDERGNCVQKTDPRGNTYTYRYDDFGNRTGETNPLGESWSLTYDGRGGLTGIATPMGRSASQEIDERGRVISFTDFSGERVEYRYDDCGNLAAVLREGREELRHAYDAHGYFRTATVDAAGFETRYEYDANHRLVKETFADGSAREYGYDCCAPLLTTDEEGHSTAVERNPAGDVLRRTDSLARQTVYEYDAAGRLSRTINPLGHALAVSYDGAGRVAAIIDPAEGSIAYGYDPAGNLISVRDELGRVTVFTYDENNRLLTGTTPLGQTVVRSRDTLGRLTEVTGARGGRISFRYDPDGQVAQKLYDGVEAAAYSYDDAGNLVAVEDATGTIAFARDRQGRVKKISYPSGLEFTFTYDASGLVKTVGYPGGFTVEHTCGSRQWLEGLTWAGGSISLSYTRTGRLAGEERSNGTSSAYRYDPTGQLIRIAHRRGAEPFVNLEYVRDALGNVVSEKGLHPLDAPDGRAAPQVLSFDDGNQVREILGEQCSCDADGNLVAAGNWSARYDHENRLAELTRDGLTTAFTYNGLGLRVRAAAGETATHLYYDHFGRLLLETDAEHRPLRRYIYAGERLAAASLPGGTTLFYHFDHRGSTVAVTGPAGEIAAAYAYDAFGRVTASEGVPAGPFTYGGAFGICHLGDGLYGTGSRCYDAASGRFLQPDPAGFAGGINLYAYADNNPVNRIDPGGLISADLGDWKFWGGLGLTGLGGVVMFIPGGQVFGVSAVKAGATLMVTGGGLTAYSVAAAKPPDLKKTIFRQGLKQGYIVENKDGTLSVDQKFMRELNITRGGRDVSVDDTIKDYEKLINEYNQNLGKCAKP